MASADRGISLPMPLIRHSKSMANGLRNSTATDTLRSGSTYSTKTMATGLKDSKVFPGVLTHLNAPLSDSTNRTPHSSDQVRVASSNRFPLQEKPEDSIATPPRPNADELLRRRTGPMSSSMGSVIPSLIDSYYACRSSMADSSGVSFEIVKMTAEIYVSQFATYLKNIESLPEEVKDCAEVGCLRDAALDAMDLFNKALAKGEQELLLLMTDKVMNHAKQLMANIQCLIVDFNKPLPNPPDLDDDDGDDASVHTTSTATTVSEVVTVDGNNSSVDANVTIVANEEGPDDSVYPDGAHSEKPERSKSLLRKVRRVKSSVLSLGGPRTRTQSTAALNDVSSVITQTTLHNNPVAESSTSVANDTESVMQKPTNKITHFACLTQLTLVDNTGNYNQDVIDQSVQAFKQVNMSNRKLRFNKSIPDDTADFTYAIDGCIKTIAEHCIIPQMMHQQLSTDIDHPGEGFIDIALSCFRYWTTPEDFARSFLHVYEREKSDIRRLSLALVIRRWLRSFWLPEYMEAVPVLKKFVGRLLYDELNTSIAQDILNRIQKHIGAGESAEKVTVKEAEVPSRFTSFRRPLAVRLQSSPNTPIFEIRSDVKLIAEQLTLIESEKYLELQPHEVMRRFILRDGAGSDIGMRMKSQAKFSEALMRWAMHVVVSQSTPTKRAKMYSFMIKLAFQCMTLQNYSSAHSIYNGLETIHLGELTQTNKLLSPKAKAGMAYLKEFFMPGNEERWLESRGRPCVPVMGGFAGKFGRLSEKTIYVHSAVDKHAVHINLILFKQATRVYYQLKNTRHSYNIKQYRPIKDYLERIVQEVSNEPYAAKATAYAEERKHSHSKSESTLEQLMTSSKVNN